MMKTPTALFCVAILVTLAAITVFRYTRAKEAPTVVTKEIVRHSSGRFVNAGEVRLSDVLAKSWRNLWREVACISIRICQMTVQCIWSQTGCRDLLAQRVKTGTRGTCASSMCRQAS
jgi:hypothetical protein